MAKLTKQLLCDEIFKLNNIQKCINTIMSDERYAYVINNEEFKNDINIKLIKFKFTFSIILIFWYFKYKNIFYETIKKIHLLFDAINDLKKTELEKRKELFKKICNQVEGRVLSEEQIDAIVREDRNQLVIAGAGSGKTTTIVGKVKFLVKVLNVNPEEILLLSFTKKSSLDMKRRVELEIGQKMECFTFHKLGLDISKQALNGLKVYEDNIILFVKEQIKRLIQDEYYLYAFIYFLTKNIYLIKDEFEFKSNEEYKTYMNVNPFVTIKGERVKSFGELEIANFLFSNSVNYKYEAKYKYNTETDEYKQYSPDFYLPDYDIYIEYFGIDRNCNVPSYFISRHGKSAKEEYNDAIIWKKNIHKMKKTKLICTYYYEKKEGILLPTLEKQLLENNVQLVAKSTKEIFNYIEQNNSGILHIVATTFGTIINLIKSNSYLLSDLRNMAEKTEYRDNIMVTIDLIEPLLDAYDTYLANNKMSDFSDMINDATSICEDGLYTSKYKYVIVDEFQDMSISRFKLLKALRETSEYKLYCVGDDFQSIYKFNGSDIGIFTNFEKYFGQVQVNKIEKTYRFSNSLAEISGNFIMKNPNQIKKQLQGYDSNRFPILEIIGYGTINALLFLEERLNYLEDNASVLLLGRYNNDIELLKNHDNFELYFNKEEQIYQVIYKNRKDLKLMFMTIHKSKGLETDYVVVLNTKDIGMGFPSRMLQLPIMNLLQDNSDKYPYSEERRLFYVALTRARKRVFLLVEKDNKSIFVKELELDYANELKKEEYSCPKCGEQLVYNNNSNVKYWICSNYNECKYIKNL